MGMPVDVPPNQPVQEQPVTREYTSGETQTLAEFLQEQSNNSESDSRSRSNSNSSQQNTNVQINNTSNVVAVDGIKLPVTTLSISAYGGQRGDFGGIFTVNIPLGGRSKKMARRNLAARTARLELEYEREFLGACSSIQQQGFVVVANAAQAQRLSQCSSNIVRVQPAVQQVSQRVVQQQTVVPRNEPNRELQELREQNALLRQQLQMLMNGQNSNIRGLN